MQISRQALYRTPTPRRPPQRRPAADPVEAAIVEEALANQTDGYRMVCAFVRRKLGIAVNRKRVLRVLRERKLIQRRRPLERRKRPGFVRVERPRQLWQLDMERHEALSNRAVVKDTASGSSQRAGEAGGSLIREAP
jgi:putative transposase